MTNPTQPTREEMISKIYEVICPGTRHKRLLDGEEYKPLYNCMLGDVLQRIRNKDLTDQHWSMYRKDYFDETIQCRDKSKLDKPIEDQPNNCISFIYSLLLNDN